MLNTLGFEELTGKVGEKFLVVKPKVEIELVEITEQAATEHQECFSLIFSGPGESSLPQNIYAIECEGEASELFLVPIASNE